MKTTPANDSVIRKASNSVYSSSVYSVSVYSLRGAMFPRAVCGLALFLALFSITVGLAGCSDAGQQAVVAKPSVVLRVVHDPEIRALLANTKEQFYARHGKLGDGTPIAIELVPELSLPAARRLAQGDLKAEAWITPLGSLADYTNQIAQPLGAKQVSCRPLFRSPLLITAPSGLVPQLQVTDGHVSWRWLMTQLEAGGAADGNSPLAYSHGFPDFSGSGVAALSLQIQIARGVKPVTLAQALSTASDANADQMPSSTAEVSPVKVPDDGFSQSIQQVAAWERLASHYSMSESYLMERVARSSSRRVYLSLATEQQLLLFQRSQRPESPSISGLFPEEGTIWNTYQLCVSAAPWVTTAHHAAIRSLGDFFNEEAGAKLASSFGFRPINEGLLPAPVAQAARTLSVVPAALPELSGPELVHALGVWPTKIEKPGALMLVLDSSGSMEGESMRAAKDSIRHLLARLSARDKVGFMTFASEVKGAVAIGSSPEQIVAKLDETTALGGSAAYDGLRAGIEALIHPDLRGYRKTLLMITDGEGQNSELSFAALQDYLGNRLSRNDVNVLVVALRREGASFNDFETIVRGVNGFFRTASPAELGSVIQDAMRNI